MRDYGYEAQQAAEQHLEACYEALYSEEEGVDGPVEPEWPEALLAPFCGCTTCVVRETLNVAWPYLEESVRAEIHGSA